MRSKKPTVTPVIASDIERVRRRLQEWRRRRKHGARIPEALWISAVKLAKKHRPARVAHELGLDYDGLKQRLNTASSEVAAKPTFIELAPCRPASHCECSIEIEDRRGAKMKLEIKSVSAVDLAALSCALWSAER
jgi:hypothetical protein